MEITHWRFASIFLDLSSLGYSLLSWSYPIVFCQYHPYEALLPAAVQHGGIHPRDSRRLRRHRILHSTLHNRKSCASWNGHCNDNQQSRTWEKIHWWLLPNKAVQFYTSVFMTLCKLVAWVVSSCCCAGTVFGRIFLIERTSKSWAIIWLVWVPSLLLPFSFWLVVSFITFITVSRW